MFATKGSGEPGEKGDTSPFNVFYFLYKILKSSLVSEEEESGAVCLWNEGKTSNTISGEMGQRTNQGSYKK